MPPAGGAEGPDGTGAAEAVTGAWEGGLCAPVVQPPSSSAQAAMNHNRLPAAPGTGWFTSRTPPSGNCRSCDETTRSCLATPVSARDGRLSSLAGAGSWLGSFATEQLRGAGSGGLQQRAEHGERRGHERGQHAGERAEDDGTWRGAGGGASRPYGQ